MTELEYNRAVERGIPRLLFLMDKTHPITLADTEEDAEDETEKARRKSKLKALKETVRKDRVVSFFKSPEDLRGLVISSLARHRLTGGAALSTSSASELKEDLVIGLDVRIWECEIEAVSAGRLPIRRRCRYAGDGIRTEVSANRRAYSTSCGSQVTERRSRSTRGSLGSGMFAPRMNPSTG